MEYKEWFFTYTRLKHLGGGKSVEVPSNVLLNTMDLQLPQDTPAQDVWNDYCEKFDIKLTLTSVTRV